MAGSDRLTRLGERAKARRERTEQLRVVLPRDLAPHLVAAEVENGRLILVLDSDQWAARARYLGPELKETLNAWDVTSFGVRVLPRAEARGDPRKDSGQAS